MAEPFFQALAQDLLALEINTIIKQDMSAIKMPFNKRLALYDIAKAYHLKLVELGIRHPTHWRYAGIKSFR